MQSKILLALAAVGFSLLPIARPATITEDFSTDPLKNGWKIVGDTNLFRWDSLNHVLRVTWDSSQPNSYFYHPLGTILGTNDDFSFSFDLQLTDYAVGVNPAQPDSFEIAAGLLNYSEVTNTAFLRGSYLTTQPDRVEFDFFQWDDVQPYPATNSIWPTFVDSADDYFYNGSSSYGVVELPTNIVMRVVMNYTAADQLCVLSITTNGTVVVAPIAVVLSAPGVLFGDYHLDTFAVESFSDAQSGGSLLAHGAIGNIVLEVPRPPVTLLEAALAHGVEQVRFHSRANWSYLLQSSPDLRAWNPVGPAVPGTGADMTLQDPHPNSQQQFYRVLALRED
jgi:hypothetical protein